MSQIEGYIIELRQTQHDENRGIVISVFIPEPSLPGCVDICFYENEEEYKIAEDQNSKDRKKYSADLENMYSLCLEDISIHPHRDLREGS